jgi:hypothetical protein
MTAKGWGGAVTPVREGVLTAVESVLTLDADFWRALGRGDAPEHVKDGTLRPDWRKRGFLRGLDRRALRVRALLLAARAEPTERRRHPHATTTWSCTTAGPTRTSR